MPPRRPGLWLLLVATAATATAVWSFPSAIPTLALGQRLTRQAALQRADSFFAAHELAPEGSRRAVRFRGNDSLRTYVDLAGGGRDTLNALLRGTDVAIFTWSVRAFLPRDPHEARVDFAPDGRVVGFRRVLAEADERPELSADDGRRLAEEVATRWLGHDLSRWRLATSSFETRNASGRVDRTYTFERTDRRVADAPIRMDVVVAGDLPTEVRPYAVIPEAFQRRYGEMRSANDLLALIAQAGLLGFLILAAFVLRHYAVEHRVRWRPALLVGGTIGALACAAGLNGLPGSWFGYDTATSPGTFAALVVMEATIGGALLALVVGLTVAAAEAVARHAYPLHVDWWKAWRHRGTRQVAGRVASGYVAALIALAYVGLFYHVTRRAGWWVPSELLDDPNLIATPMPWISGIAAALQAGVWEETLFRALPLSLLALWANGRPRRAWWMAAGVVGTALVFGFAHSNYPSWPPYSRGIEIFLDACFWAVLFLWLGLVVTVVAHFAYDLVLFGLFAASGSGLAYRLTAVIILLALLAPVLSVVWRWIRQRRLAELPDEGRFGAWTPVVAVSKPAPARPVTSARSLEPAARTAAVTAGALALLVVVLMPSPPQLGEPFTVGRGRVAATADSVARARGVDPALWRQLSTTGHDATAGWRRFLAREDATALAESLAATYVPAAWWTVRYVRTGGTAAERAEEWRVRIWPDGAPLDVQHVVPEATAGATLSAEEASRLARAAIARAGLDTLGLRSSDVEATERPARRDYVVTYSDTTVHLPGDAAARVRVTITGDEPAAVRRSIELPEAFTRAERERVSTRLVTTIVLSTILVLLIGVGVMLVMRRRAPVLDDGLLTRRRSLAVVGVLTVLGLASALNRAPSELASYDTAMPWSNWVGIHVVTAVLTVLPALAVLGLWLLLGALRRRVGIPLLPAGVGTDGPDPGRRTRWDVLLAGLGLGAMPTVLKALLGLASRTGIPGAPTTSLDQAVPWLGGALSMPVGVVVTVTLVAIPALAVAGVSTRPYVRALAVAAVLAPLVALAVVVTPTGASALLRASVLVAGLLVAGGISLRFWAPSCAWAWLVAGLVDAALTALRGAVHAPTTVEHLGGVVTLLAVSALLVAALRVVRADSGVPRRGEAVS